MHDIVRDPATEIITELDSRAVILPAQHVYTDTFPD
jgi:hypothetical protein